MKRLSVRPVPARPLPLRAWRLALLVCLMGGIVLTTGCGSKDKKMSAGDPRDVATATGRGPDFGPADRPGGGAAEKKEMEKRADGEPAARPHNDILSGTAQGGGEVDKKPDKPQPPKVWHRDRARPTFARVYVGDKKSLELVSLHVNVVVEGHRARTTVDHVFRNPHGRQLEGMFEYPLPAGASPSYYALFLGATRDAEPARFKPPAAGKPPLLPEALAPAQLARQIDAADWGKLQEARLVPPEKAVETYEEVVRGQVDPALFEYASGNTFRGRVFPIPPKGYNRVI